MEYLPTLLERSKWRFQDRDLQVNDVVLVVDELPRGEWLTGWVTKVFVGQNGRVRSALVRTPQGEYDRPIVRLCLLEEASPPLLPRTELKRTQPLFDIGPDIPEERVVKAGRPRGAAAREDPHGPQ